MLRADALQRATRAFSTRPWAAISVLVPISMLVFANALAPRVLVPSALVGTAVLVGYWIAAIVRSQVIVHHHGIIDVGPIRRREHRWAEVACVAIRSHGRGSTHLAACHVGDQRPRPLRGYVERAGAFELELLADAGYAVADRTDDCMFWWHLDPRSRVGT